MIDDKKIEEAKRAFIADKKILGIVVINDLARGFKAGAKWMQEEFLKGLWHDASEDPKMTNQENEFVECLVRIKDGIVCLYNYDTWHHWWCSDEDNQKFLGLIDKWLYIDDLLTNVIFKEVKE